MPLNVSKNISIFSSRAITFTLVLGLSACANETSQSITEHYSMADFEHVAKIDAHVHVNNTSGAFIEQAKRDNITLVSINVDYPDFPAIDTQAEIALQQASRYPQSFHFATTFSMQGSDQPQWQDQVIQRIDSAVNAGAIAVKVWKNIGMDYRDQTQNLVMIDDPRFDRIFTHVQHLGIPLIGHQGEPRNCWLPLAEMTVNNDKQYFAQHPQYHMYLHAQLPSYEAQIQARNNMLNKHTRLNFMGAHLASLEWSVDKIAAFLDTYPHAVVDMAERLGHIQYQSQLDRNKVRQFFIEYQDRILYATDLTHAPETSEREIQQGAHKKWREDWRYLNTKQHLTVPEVNGEIIGLALPKGVINKIYFANAQRFFVLKDK